MSSPVDHKQSSRSTALVHAVYRSINKPLTICGAERRLFFLAAMMGGATFNLFGSLIGGVFMFTSLYLLARWATATDPEILRILLNASSTTRFECAKTRSFVLRLK